MMGERSVANTVNASGDKSTRPSLFTREAFSRTADRVYPFPPVKIASITLASADLILTSPENENLLLKGLTLSNGTGSPVLVTCLSVPVGDVNGDEHIVFDQIEVSANSVVSLSSKIMVAPLGRFLVFAGTANSIRVSGWLKAYL